jgi:hypothetical protein
MKEHHRVEPGIVVTTTGSGVFLEYVPHTF